MSPDQTFRLVLLAGWLVLVPIMGYHRVKSQATGEPLDRRQEGLFILFTLRPLGLAAMLGLVTFIINPQRMAWASVPLPVWIRWMGVGIGVIGGGLLVWTLRNLGPNLTDTVVTRREHTLVTSGPYRHVRHPFYGAVTLSLLANALATANAFLFVTGCAVVALLVLRTDREEERLLHRFGEPYRRYVAQTGRFVPWI